MDDNLCQFPASELSRGKIHRYFDVVWPTCGIEAGLTDHPFAQRNYKTGVHRHWDELRGREHAALGMVPAQQSFQTNDPIVFYIDDWLVEQLELTVDNRSLQVGFQCAPRCDAGNHFRFKEPVDAATI